MRAPFAHLFRACCVAGVLICAVLAAERKTSLIGASRAEVLARFGEPKSQMVAGSREVLIFATERVTLRDNRVIEAEELFPESASAAKPPIGAPASSTGSVSGSETTPAAPTESASAPVLAAEPPATSSAPTVAKEPEVVIKAIRPPSRTSSQRDEAIAAPSPSPLSSPATPVAPTTPAEASATPSSSTAAAPAAPLANTERTSIEEPTQRQQPAPVVTPLSDTSAPRVVNTAPQTAPKPVERPSSDPLPKPVQNEPGPSLTKIGGYALIVLIGSALAYLIWRSRKRRVVTATTSPTQSPFAAEPVPARAGKRFTTEFLSLLEWKRFEELVAAYYNKTGVVAVRTKSGPVSAVHIRISWKGETRPFACVQCVAHPPAAIGPNSIQALREVLAAENIRRGYVVSPGKFDAAACALADENKIALIPGDAFAEKLNTLPDLVRDELMQDAIAGEPFVPTCPRCDIKMVRADATSSWRCLQCGTPLPRW